MDVELGDLVELRLIGAENTESEARRLMWTYHTFHLHGYNFNVMSMGFPITDDEGKVQIYSLLSLVGFPTDYISNTRIILNWYKAELSISIQIWNAWIRVALCMNGTRLHLNLVVCPVPTTSQKILYLYPLKVMSLPVSEQIILDTGHFIVIIWCTTWKEWQSFWTSKILNITNLTQSFQGTVSKINSILFKNREFNFETLLVACQAAKDMTWKRPIHIHGKSNRKLKPVQHDH